MKDVEVLPVLLIARVDRENFKALVNMKLDEKGDDGISALENILLDLAIKAPELAKIIQNVAKRVSSKADGWQAVLSLAANTKIKS